MSEATRAKNFKQRATIAIRKIKANSFSGRSFADCFEMNDGDQVVAEIIKRANKKPNLKQVLIDRGFSHWLNIK